MTNLRKSDAPRPRYRSPIAEPNPPAVVFQVVCRLDMQEMAEHLNPQQISAVMGGIAQVIAASKVQK
jgi:hypothetical protein